MSTKPVKGHGGQHYKPVSLQMNNSGAWKHVIYFDAADDLKSTHVLDAADTLACIGVGVTFRVITNDGFQTILTVWSGADGWKPWRQP